MKTEVFRKNYVKDVSRKISVAKNEYRRYNFRNASFDPVGYWADFVIFTQRFGRFYISTPPPKLLYYYIITL